MHLALLAGTHSGCGKTTVMLALLQYLKNHALNPRAFKVGPDFLDPLWHAAVTGLPSYNLDTQMVGIDESRRLLNQLAKDDEYCLIEGVMGMFDGRDGVGQVGSSVDLAAKLGVAVILVVDAQGMSGSIVPLVSGYCDFARFSGVTIAGIIANRVGGDHHAQLLQQALADYQLPPLIAWLNKNAPVLKERHLGLKIPDGAELPDFQSAIQIDSELLLNTFIQLKSDQPDYPVKPSLQGRVIAIAKDQACCFIYPANVDWLLEQGAQLVWFSPLAGESVPDADALWLPGGYPELHVEKLAQSTSWDSLRKFVESGRPVLAECGGAMLLGEALIDLNGQTWPMANILPFKSRMQNKLAALGYREDASGMRGHEFHYSIRQSATSFTAGFACTVGDKGIHYKNLRASYNHWYFSSASGAATEWFT